MPAPFSPPAAAADLLRWPVVGRLLRARHIRTVAQTALLIVAIAIVAHGLLGPDLAPKNLATVLTWIHYRGLLIGALLAIGNLFCGACPMILVRDLGRRLHRPTRSWPRWLRRKWVALGLFVAVLFAYELFDLWSWPAATAWLVVGYFGAALLVDLTFTGATFCKFVCPVGQFNFVASTLSPLEVGVREVAMCHSCTTVDCIKGRAAAPDLKVGLATGGATAGGAVVPAGPTGVAQRGCELALFQPLKVGNLDCTFCLDCVQACPHDNVAIRVRVPGEELADDRRRSSIGRLSKRTDLAALALVFTFSALLNAFAMTGPVYATEAWLARAIGTTHEAPVLALVFVAGLGLLPLGLVGGAAALTRRLARSPLGVREIAVRYAYAFVPFGVGVWLAHYGFHFLTGVGTVVPVTQSAVIDATGTALLGHPDWRWLGMRPGAVFPLQLGVVLLGAMGSLVLAHRVSERDHPGGPMRASAPWMLAIIAVALLALWILAQPMEMRGTGLGG
ncbi:MAG: FesM [Vicinamibacterales bacterium]